MKITISYDKTRKQFMLTEAPIDIDTAISLLDSDTVKWEIGASLMANKTRDAKKNPILRGQYVRVFKDCLSEKKPIGIAEVIKYGGATTHVTRDGVPLHWCDLRFHNRPPEKMDQALLVTVKNIITEDESGPLILKKPGPRDADIDKLKTRSI